MSLYGELIEWAESRPWWQQQALARLASGEKVGPEDHPSIAASLLEPAPTPPPGGWLADVRPPAESAEDQVKLVCVRDVKNVNRLRPDERLTFGTNGVTVVFGFNGSGKSGYARLVKQMVRTRHREEILPDVFGGQQQSREGHLDYTVGGGAAEADLAGGPPLPLGRVAFYDEKCGDAYLTTEAEIAYRPSALTLLDDLYDVCEGVRRELDRLLTENTRAAVPLPPLAQGSPSAAFVASLDADTSDGDIEAACTLPDGHESETARLEAEEARLRSTNPEQEKARLTSAAGSVEALSAHVKHLEQALGDDRATALRELDGVAREKRAAASMASTASFDGEPVVGVGTSTWRALWEAARRFSETEAYPAETYPHTGEAAHCVLCQQRLSGDASQRLNRFDAFLADDTEQQAERAEADLAKALGNITTVDVEPAAVAVAAASLDQSHSDLKARVDRALAAFRSRRDSLAAQALPEHLPGADIGGLVGYLDGLADQQRSQAQAIEAGDFAVRIEEVARQRRDLGARIALAGAKSTLVAERDRLLARRCIDEARKQTATTGLTTKVGELTRKYVTVAVQDRFSASPSDCGSRASHSRTRRDGRAHSSTSRTSSALR